MTPEACVLTAADTIQSVATGPAPLTATLGEPTGDTNLGDRSGKTITWTGRDSQANTPGTLSATPSTNGLAATTVPLTGGVYDFTHALQATATTARATRQPTRSSPSLPPRSQSPAEVGSPTAPGHTSFGFNAKNDVTGLPGQFQLNTHNGGAFHGNTVLSLTSKATTATRTGTGIWNGHDGYQFSITVTDNGNATTKAGTLVMTIAKGPLTVFKTNDDPSATIQRRKAGWQRRDPPLDSLIRETPITAK